MNPCRRRVCILREFDNREIDITSSIPIPQPHHHRPQKKTRGGLEGTYDVIKCYIVHYGRKKGPSKHQNSVYSLLVHITLLPCPGFSRSPHVQASVSTYALSSTYAAVCTVDAVKKRERENPFLFPLWAPQWQRPLIPRGKGGVQSSFFLVFGLRFLFRYPNFPSNNWQIRAKPTKKYPQDTCPSLFADPAHAKSHSELSTTTTTTTTTQTIPKPPRTLSGFLSHP